MNANLSIATASQNPPPGAANGMEASADDVLNQIGIITRRLHDALSELGYDKTLARAANALPDARARLSYIGKLTGEAAEKVLTTVDAARATQNEMRKGADDLKARWNGKPAQSLGNPDGEALVADTKEFLGNLSMSTDLANSYLTDIMLAQDFHDLTGQVVGKLVGLAQTLEEQLLALLLETSPAERRARAPAIDTDVLNGPVISAEGRTDIVTSQSQVDELLESLGF